METQITARFIALWLTAVVARILVIRPALPPRVMVGVTRVDVTPSLNSGCCARHHRQDSVTVGAENYTCIGWRIKSMANMLKTMLVTKKKQSSLVLHPRHHRVVCT